MGSDNMIARLARVVVGVLLLASGAAFGQAAIPGVMTPKAPETGLHAILLGTGMPVPNPERAAASTLIVAGGTTFMVDTGFGSLPRLVEAGYQEVDHVLFTHFHIDHFGDFGWVLFTRGTAGAEEAQSVFGPRGTVEFVQKLVDSVAVDERYRIEHHGEHWPKESMQALVREFDPGVIYDKDGVKVTMFLVDHEPIEVAVGYRFDYEGKSIVVSGDTVKSDSLIAAAQGCDLLIHEAMNATVLNAILPALKRRNPRQGALVEDLMDVHTPTLEVAEVAAECGAKKLVLTHMVPSIAPVEAQERNFIRGMAEIYSGPIVVGRDGMVFSVE